MRKLVNKMTAMNARQVTLAAIAMLVLHLIFRAALTRNSWFINDDFVFLTAAAMDEVNLSWILERYNRHLLPLGRAQAALVGMSQTPFDWNLAWAQIMFWTAATAFSAWYMLKTLFGSRPAILIPLGFYLFGSMAFAQSIWWSSAIIRMPMSAAIFLTTAFLVQYLRSKKFRYLIGFVAANVLGLSAYMNMVLMALPFALLALFYFTEGGFWERIRQGFRKYWLILAVVFATNATYLYFFLTWESEKIPEIRQNAIFDTFDIFVFSNALTGMIGGPIRWQETLPLGSYPPILLIVIAAIAIGFFVLERSRTNLFILPSLVILGSYLLLVAFTVAWGTGGHWGPEYAGREPRYLADVAAVTTLCLGTILMPIKNANSVLRPKEAAAPARSSKNLWVAQIGIAAFLISGLYSTTAYALTWNDEVGKTSRDYVTNARLSLFGREDGIAEGFVPDYILIGAFYPDNKFSRFFAPIGSQEFVTDRGTDLETLDLEGNVQPAFIDQPPTHFPGETPGCGYLINKEQPVTIEIAPTGYLGTWLSIGYLSGAPGHMVISTDGFWRRLEVADGLHTAFVFVNKRIDEITITPSPGTGLCVDAVRAGDLSPMKD